ncbi:MAG: FYDLN acid domain-containing protein [Alphaproteobacteria bacterium]|nr:FYDLN acid domain-containing protein [Alphaproteobacteria bacterium]
MASKAARGTKRTCQNDDCATHFYDLNRTPIVCPICETEYVIASAPLPPPEPEPAKEKKEKETSEASADGEDALDGAEGIEDIEDSDDIDDDDDNDTFLATDDDSDTAVPEIITGSTKKKADDET